MRTMREEICRTRRKRSDIERSNPHKNKPEDPKNKNNKYSWAMPTGTPTNHEYAPFRNMEKKSEEYQKNTARKQHPRHHKNRRNSLTRTSKNNIKLTKTEEQHEQ